MKKATHTIIFSSSIQVVTLLVASVGLIFLAFFRPYLSWLLFVSLIPLLFAIEVMQKESWSNRKITFAIWLMGWVFMALVTSWILSINTTGWSYIPTSPLFAMIVFAWITFSLLLSTGFALTGYLIAKLKLKLTAGWAILVLPSIWILSEFIRSHVATFGSLGPSGMFGNFFSFGSLGLAASDTALGYAGRIVGMYGLSFLVVAINIGVYGLIIKQWKTALAILGVAFALSLVGYYAYQPPPTEQYASVIQLAQTDKSSYSGEIINSLKSADADAPSELIILPEYANFFEYGNTDSNNSAIQLLTKGKPSLIIFSRSKNNPNGLHKNEIVYKTSTGAEISSQEKNFLIPAGEYMPYLLQFVLKLIGEAQITDIFTVNVGVAKGGNKERPVKYNGVNYGALACSGVIAPQLYMDLTRGGAEILVNTASLDVFKDTSTFRMQSKTMARFIATANARPFLQSARGSYAFIMDGNGNTLAQSDHEGFDVLSASIKPSGKKTLYAILGEYVLIIAGAIIALYALLTFKILPKKNRKNKTN